MSDQPVLNLFPVDHLFRKHHAALRTRTQIVGALTGAMYSEFQKENAEEVMTALVSLKSLFQDCLTLSSEMVTMLDEQLQEEVRRYREYHK